MWNDHQQILHTVFITKKRVILPKTNEALLGLLEWPNPVLCYGWGQHPFEGTGEYEHVFKNLIEALGQIPTLTFLDISKPFMFMKERALPKEP